MLENFKEQCYIYRNETNSFRVKAGVPVVKNWQSYKVDIYDKVTQEKPLDDIDNIPIHKFLIRSKVRTFFQFLRLYNNDAVNFFPRWFKQNQYLLILLILKFR